MLKGIDEKHNGFSSIPFKYELRIKVLHLLWWEGKTSCFFKYTKSAIASI